MSSRSFISEKRTYSCLCCGAHFTRLIMWLRAHDVILAARTDAKGQDEINRIRRELPSHVWMERPDLASLRSVRTFAEKISYEVKLDPREMM